MLAATHRRPKQQTRSVETRRAILAAAERVFARSGLAGARTDAIAAEAGVNKALLYYYFKSKQSLYRAVIEEQFRGFNEHALKLLDGPGRAGDVLSKYIGMHFDFISQRRWTAPIFQQLMMSGGKSMQSLVRKYFAPRSKALNALLERGMREGEFRKAERFHTAISIIAVIVFYCSAAPVIQSLGHEDVYSEANLAKRKREMIDFVRHAVFADPGAKSP